MDRPKTLGEALSIGYKYAFTKLERGYLSRKGFISDDPSNILYVAGGKRKGMLYYIEPCFMSTQYFFRRYIDLH